MTNFCFTFQMPDNVRLKIHYNSTRPAPLEAKLGYQTDPFPLLINLNDVKLNGGHISSVLVYVTRVYPPIFHDKNAKQYYSEHQERRLSSKWEMERQSYANKILEETTEEVKKEFREQQKLNVSKSMIKIQHARAALEGDADSSDITASQYVLIGNENDRVNDEIVRRCLDKSKTLTRQVSPCLRLGVLDVHHPREGVILTLWNAKDIYNPYIKENLVFKITNLNPSITEGKLRLFSTNKTNIKAVKQESFNVPESFKRKVTEIEDLPQMIRHPPPFEEVDILGLVVSIQKTIGGQIAFIANAKADTVSIKFANSIEENGYADVVKEGTLLLLQNLKWQSVGSNTPIPTLFVSPLYTKITSLSGRKVTKEQQRFVDGFHGIKLNEFSRELSEKLGTELNLQKINESLADTTIGQEMRETSVNRSSDTSVGTKRKRLGNASHMSAKKKVCTRLQKSL